MAGKRGAGKKKAEGGRKLGSENKRNKTRKKGLSWVSMAQLVIAGGLLCSVFFNMYQYEKVHGFLQAGSPSLKSSRSIRGASIDVVFHNKLDTRTDLFWSKDNSAGRLLTPLHPGKAVKLAVQTGHAFLFQLSGGAAAELTIIDPKLNLYELVKGPKASQYIIKGSVVLPDSLVPVLAQSKEVGLPALAEAAVETPLATDSPATAKVEVLEAKAVPLATKSTELQAQANLRAAKPELLELTTPAAASAVVAAAIGGAGSDCGNGYLRFEEANAENPPGYDVAQDETVYPLDKTTDKVCILPRHLTHHARSL
jgi:hypothetical protein